MPPAAPAPVPLLCPKCGRPLAVQVGGRLYVGPVSHTRKVEFACACGRWFKWVPGVRDDAPEGGDGP
jgi:hypothetical protein